MHNPLLKILRLLILFSFPLFGLSQKTDKVTLKNGDVLTGEIKYMKLAKLTFDQDGPGLIDIKWEYIVKIRSNKTFQVTMKNGDVLVTTLDSVFFEVPHHSLDNIVDFVRIKDKFKQRLSGDISLGANYSKSSDIFSFNFASSITYRIPKNELAFRMNAVLSKSRSDTALSRKEDITFGYLRRLENSFYLGSTIGWQQNTQLGLNNRYFLNGVGGKIPINNNHQRLLTGVGLSFTEEQSNQSPEFKSNLEALGTVQYKQFRYSFPKLSIDATFTVFPSLTEWGRVRMDFQLNTSVEIFKDFNAGLGFYDNFDNRPPEGAASKNDFSVNFTITYKFGK